jgi:formiminoglutamase
LDPLAEFRDPADDRDPRAPGLLRAEPEGLPDGAWRLLGLPYDGGIPSRPGARFGPAALRAALSAFTDFDGENQLRPILDLGDLALPTMNAEATHARIEGAAARLFATRAPLFTVGGDHGCTGSIVRGLAAARPELRLSLISIDAHLDVREYEGSTTISSGTPFRRALETQILEGPRVAMIGLRPFANSRYHLDWARERGVHLYFADDVARRGARDVVEEALERAAADADGVYLSVDMDAVDAAFAPGVSASGIGGLSSREVLQTVAVVARDSRLLGADVMELSPPHDHDSRTAKLAARLLLEALRVSAR